MTSRPLLMGPSGPAPKCHQTDAFSSGWRARRGRWPSPGGGSGGRDREVRRGTLGERGVPEQRHDQRREHDDPRCQSCSGELGGGQHACFVLDYQGRRRSSRNVTAVGGPTHADHRAPPEPTQRALSGAVPAVVLTRPSKRCRSPALGRRASKLHFDARPWCRAPGRPTLGAAERAKPHVPGAGPPKRRQGTAHTPGSSTR